MKKIISGCVFFYTNSLTPYKAAAASQKTLLALGRAIVLLWCLVNVTSAQQNNKPVYNVDKYLFSVYIDSSCCLIYENL